MAIVVREILSLLDSRYPFRWAVGDDRVGLQVGQLEAPVDSILVALEVSEAVVAEAVEQGAQLLLTHHPFFYRPWQEVREDHPHGRLLCALIRAGVTVVSCHTNLDLAPGGVNDYLAQLLELEEVTTFSEAQRDGWVKLTTFVPVGYEERVRRALFDDRIGVIGEYTHCSFSCRGQGTFLPLAEATPFRGEAGTLSRAEEARLEVLVPSSRINAAVSRLKAAHPYEEVAYDLYPLQNDGLILGFGRMGRWRPARGFVQVIHRLKEIFGVSRVRVWGWPPEVISRVAVAGGSAGELIIPAKGQGAQLFITGEVRHHQVNIVDLRDFAVVELGHYQSEVVFLPEWARQLEKLFKDSQISLKVRVSEAQGMPITYC